MNRYDARIVGEFEAADDEAAQAILDELVRMLTYAETLHDISAVAFLASEAPECST